MQMLALGLNHKTTPVNVRGTIAFSESDIEKTLLKLSFYEGIGELIILSTCNRTEFYVITPDLEIANNSIIKFIEKEKNINYSEIKHCFYTYYNKFAAEHLYRVTSGIDSLILGEGEILSQVKNAFSKAMEVGTSGKIFNALFRFAIESGKKVRTETSISQRPTSTGSVVSNLVRKKFNDLSSKTALFIGAGKISQITAKNLKSHNIGRTLILNRTYQKAIDLANEVGAEAYEYNKLNEIIDLADVIVVGVGAPDYIVKESNYNPNKEVLIVDLSMPRNVEPNLIMNPLIDLYDIDSLETTVSVNKEERLEIIKEVEFIIAEEMNKFLEWFNSLDISPVISSLSNLFEEIRNNEVDRVIKKYRLDNDNKKIIDIVTKSIVQKITHYPVTNLKMTEDKKLKKQYSENLTYLFQLDSQDSFQKYFRKKDNKIEVSTNSEIIDITTDKELHNSLKISLQNYNKVFEDDCPISVVDKIRCPFAKI
jgi:glutamyl-tRNA reductase